MDGRGTSGVSVAGLALAALGRSLISSSDRVVENRERDGGGVGSEGCASASMCASPVASCAGKAGVNRLDPRAEAQEWRVMGVLIEGDRLAEQTLRVAPSAALDSEERTAAALGVVLPWPAWFHAWCLCLAAASCGAWAVGAGADGCGPKRTLSASPRRPCRSTEPGSCPCQASAWTVVRGLTLKPGSTKPQAPPDETTERGCILGRS